MRRSSRASTKPSKIRSWCRVITCSASNGAVSTTSALGGNSPEDDLAFATVARVSEANQGLYRTLLSPAARATTDGARAELSRRMHPNRLRFQMFADENPVMQPIAKWAGWVRDNRRPVSPNNPFLAFQQMMSDTIANSLEAWGKARDTVHEAIFFNTYGSPWLQAMVGLRSDGSSAGRPSPAAMATRK